MEETTFVAQLLKCKSMHEALLMALVGDPHAAEDLYQQAAMVMTRKRAELPEDVPFAAWSRSVIVNVVRDYRKMMARRRVRVLEDSALEQVARAFERLDDDYLTERRDALRECLNQLQDEHRAILWQRYDERLSFDELARRHDRSSGALETLLYRLRKVLADCIDRRLRQTEASA